MAQNSLGSYNISNSVRKRPFTIDTSTQHEFFNKDSIGIHSDTTQTSSNASIKPTNSSKRKRRQPPAAHSSSQELQGQLDLRNTTAITPVYINLPYKISPQRSVPAFLHKLYNMIGDPSTDPFIHWSNDGNSFIVEGHEEFARLILPRFYKHNTFASFVRQLNMYDFHKVPHLQQGVLLSTSSNPEIEVWEFSCANFKKNRPDLLILVTRKRNRDRQEADADPVNLGALVKEISSIKKHQMNISADLRNLHRDNEIIWQETLEAREKHQKHQKVITKILQFLTVVFSNDHKTLTNLDNEEILNNSGQSQQSTATNNNNNTKNLSKSISECNVSKRDSSCDSALGNSDSGAASSDSDGNDDSNPTCTHLHGYFGNALNDNDSPKSKPNVGNKDIPNQIIDKKQKPNANSLPIDETTLMAQPMVFTDAMAKHNARSAQAITDDIDQLQENVEILAAQLGIDPTQFSGEKFNDVGGFSKHYSNMIASASRTDKNRLFDLADGKKKLRSKQHIPQQSPYLFVSNNNQPCANRQLQSNQNQLNGDTSHADQTTNNNDFSFFFRHLFKSVDPTFEEASIHSINGTTTCNNTQSLDANLHTAYCNSVPLIYTPNDKTEQQPQQQFQVDDTQLFNASTVNRQSLQIQNLPSNNHLSFRHNRQQHNKMKNNDNNTTMKEAPYITPYYIAPASIIPPQPQPLPQPQPQPQPQSQPQQQHIYKHSFHQTNQFSYQQASQANPNICSQQHQQKSVNTVGDNFVEILQINAPSYIVD